MPHDLCHLDTTRHYVKHSFAISFAHLISAYRPISGKSHSFLISDSPTYRRSVLIPISIHSFPTAEPLFLSCTCADPALITHWSRMSSHFSCFIPALIMRWSCMRSHFPLIIRALIMRWSTLIIQSGQTKVRNFKQQHHKWKCSNILRTGPLSNDPVTMYLTDEGLLSLTLVSQIYWLINELNDTFTTNQIHAICQQCMNDSKTRETNV